MLKKILSYVILTSILIYGIFRYKVLELFAPVVRFLLELVGIDPFEIIQYLNQTTIQKKWNENTLGWLIYYPSYFFLHIAFISVLYKGNKKVRNILILALFSIVAIIMTGILVFKFLEIRSGYNSFVNIFRSLFGLPFIILAIEGGRILYKDVQELLEKE